MRCTIIRAEEGKAQLRCNFDVQDLDNAQWYGLSDLEVERQMADRISFMSFLGFQINFLIRGRFGYSENAWQRP